MSELFSVPHKNKNFGTLFGHHHIVATAEKFYKNLRRIYSVENIDVSYKMTLSEVGTDRPSSCFYLLSLFSMASTGSKSFLSSRHCKCGSYHICTAKQRAEIGKYALNYGSDEHKL